MTNKNSKLKTQNYKIWSLKFGHWNFKAGQIMIISMVFLAIILIISASLFGRTASFLNFGSRSIATEQAINLAEAGLNSAIWQLNQTAGAYTGETDTAVGTTGTFTVSITNKTSSLKTVTAIGYVPNATSPKNKKTIKADVLIDSTQIAFNYAVQVGTGGVNMENSSRIIGTVYSNKSGTNSIQGFGSSEISGDAWAVGTISSPDPFVTGTKHPNSSASQMPTVDYQQWKDEAVAIQTTNCSVTCNYVSGTPSLKGKYVGNLEIQNTAQAVMDGTMWVTGNVTVRNTAKLKLNDSFGSNGSVLITDGIVSTENSGGFTPTNANPKGYILVVSTSNNSTTIDVKNSGVNAVFYALNGGATMQNNAQVTALVANQLTIKNAATLTYDSGLASSQFTSGPGGSWQIKKGTYRFTSSP